MAWHSAVPLAKETRWIGQPNLDSLGSPPCPAPEEAPTRKELGSGEAFPGISLLPGRQGPNLPPVWNETAEQADGARRRQGANDPPMTRIKSERTG